MKLYHSGVRQNAQNTIYPYEVEIKSCKDIIEAVEYDNTCAKCKDYYRKNGNFLEADCIMFDVDNTHSENPNEWINPKDVQKMFMGVPFYVVYSRNHLKVKNGKAPRPKFHIYFADKVFTSVDEYTKLKKIVCSYFTAFDPAAKDAARFFFGVENPQVEYFDGNVLLYDFMKTVRITADNVSKKTDTEKADNAKHIVSLDDDVIPEGRRNNKLISYAVSVLKRYGDVSETAHELYIKRSECCSPLLEEAEVQSIWESGLKFYREEIKTSRDYVEPKKFNGTNKILASFKEEFIIDVKDEQAFSLLLTQNYLNKCVDVNATRLFLQSFGISILLLCQ